MDQKIVFQESQFFRSNPLTFLIWPVVLFIWVVAFLQLVMGIEIGEKLAPNSLMLILWLVVGVLVPLLFLAMRLSVTLTEHDIHIKYAPFTQQTISLTEIVMAEARRSNALQEYGGWGLRFSPTYGRSYTIKGTEGVQLELRSGQKIFIGSTSAPRLAELLHERLTKYSR